MSLAELQCAYSVLEYKHSTLQKQNQRGKSKAPNQNAKRHKGADNIPATRLEDMTYYHASARSWQARPTTSLRK